MRFAHVSDLHVGKNGEYNKAAERLALSLLESGVDHVIVTGDITESGKQTEGWRFRDAFWPLRNKTTLLPGNHDRGSDDYGATILEGRDIWVEQPAGLYLVCLDSTTPENSALLHAHGEVSMHTVLEAERALRYAPPDAVPIVLLHHHVVRLPGDGFADNISDALGLPFAREVSNGQALLRSIAGKCPLVLHGHRHTPKALHIKKAGFRPVMAIYNAGSTTELGRYRVFEHEEGLLTGVSWQSFL